MGANGRPWYFWALIAFVAGLLIGLVVLGWGLWPVTWTNATVQDLRPELRQQYVTMVAESFAQTRNVEVARQRLAGWSEKDLAALLASTRDVLAARDPASATNVQGLAVALGAVEAAPGAAPGQAQPPAGAAPGAAAEAPAQQPSLPRRICTGGIFFLIAVGAVVLIFYLFRKWRAARDLDEAELASPDYSSLTAPSAAAAAAEQEKARPLTPRPYEWEENYPATQAAVPPAYPPARPGDDDGLEPPPVTSQVSSTPRPVGPAPSAPPYVEPVETRTPPPGPPPPVSPAQSTAGMQVLVANTAIYQAGEPDYDEAFDINDPVDGYMGQCGLQLIEPFGRERDQAVALQVWLWDSSDPDTQTLVLMSEGAYRDTAMRSQYSGEHQAISVRPGSEFELKSHDLLLRGRVEKVSYAEAEPVRGVYADLQVKLTVYRRS